MAHGVYRVVQKPSYLATVNQTGATVLLPVISVFAGRRMECCHQ